MWHFFEKEMTEWAMVKLIKETTTASEEKPWSQPERVVNWVTSLWPQQTNIFQNEVPYCYKNCTLLILRWPIRSYHLLVCLSNSYKHYFATIMVISIFSGNYHISWDFLKKKNHSDTRILPLFLAITTGPMFSPELR